MVCFGLGTANYAFCIMDYELKKYYYGIHRISKKQIFV